MHTCVSRCGAVTVSQCGLSGWESIGSTPQQDTGKPALQIHAHNTSDKPEEGEKSAWIYLQLNITTCSPTQKHSIKIFFDVFHVQHPTGRKKKKDSPDCGFIIF